MIGLIANIVGWIATFFRAAGMLMKRAMLVKALVSVGNALWLANGLLTHNAPLVASNGICLAIMLYEIIITNIKKNKDGGEGQDN